MFVFESAILEGWYLVGQSLLIEELSSHAEVAFWIIRSRR